MAVPALQSILQLINATIPDPILRAAFKPHEFQTTLDERILSEIIDGRVLSDVNMLIGKKTRFTLTDEWKITVLHPAYAFVVGAMFDASFYFIPPEVREFRDITQIETISDNYNYALPINNGGLENNNNFGNTLSTLANAALASRTLANTPIMPQVLLQSKNIIKVMPETWSEGIIINCKLGYDREFTNINQNVLYPLRQLVLNATKTYIYNKLVLEIDMSQVVGGMAIGKFKDIVDSYENEAQGYDEYLMALRGGSIMDPQVYAAYLRMAI